MSTVSVRISWSRCNSSWRSAICFKCPLPIHCSVLSYIYRSDLCSAYIVSVCRPAGKFPCAVNAILLSRNAIWCRLKCNCLAVPYTSYSTWNCISIWCRTPITLYSTLYALTLINIGIVIFNFETPSVKLISNSWSIPSAVGVPGYIDICLLSP